MERGAGSEPDRGVSLRQEAIRTMKAQQPRGGRIINNGSISAHTPRPYSAPYTATKHGITGLTKSIALDCRQLISVAGRSTSQCGDGDDRAHGFGRAAGQRVARARPRMDVKNVADAVLYMASLPLDANVLFMTVMANTMPFAGRG